MTLTSFSDLGVLPEITEPLADAGITTPFPIQEMTLSIALLGTDLIGQARTGTGKTLAFGIPVVQRAVAQIGRASCRERVWRWVGAVGLVKRRVQDMGRRECVRITDGE